MRNAGDALLYAMSCWRETSWGRFKAAYDAIWNQSGADGTNSATDQGRSLERWTTAWTLSALSHVDIVRSGDRLSLAIAPAALCRLPLAGLPRAVLCGARSPSLIVALKRLAGRFGVLVAARPQSSLRSIVPSLVTAAAASDEALGIVAAGAGVQYLVRPPSWDLAGGLGSVDEYLSRLAWESVPELNWACQHFESRSWRFVDGEPPSGLRLTRYRDPIRNLWSYRLWQDGNSAQVDPTWARYAVAKATGHIPLSYQERDGTVAAPVGLPLPALAARALTLCSGVAPQRQSSDVKFVQVPPDVFEVVARKLGQNRRDGEP